MLTALFSFQFKDVLYENGEQTGADDSPGESIAQLFSNTKCSLGESKQCGEGGKAGEVNGSRGSSLEGGASWRICLVYHSRKHRWCPQQGALGLTRVGGNASVVVKGRPARPGLPYATHPCVGTHTRPGRGGRRLSLI